MPYIIYGEKTLERKYGDVFFLYQIMDNFKDFDEFNLVIISEEKKKDWVVQVDCEGKKVLGVLPQIKQQIYAKNPKAQKIILMDTLSFIKDLADITHQTLSDEIVGDVEKSNIFQNNVHLNNDYIEKEIFLAHLKNSRNRTRLENILEQVLLVLNFELEPLIEYSKSMLRNIQDTGVIYSYQHCQELIDDFVLRHYTKFIDACAECMDIHNIERQDEIVNIVKGLIDRKIHSS